MRVARIEEAKSSESETKRTLKKKSSKKPKKKKKARKNAKADANYRIHQSSNPKKNMALIQEDEENCSIESVNLQY